MKKKLVKSLDKILKCCIFASCLEFNKTTTITITLKTNRNEKRKEIQI